MGFLVRGLSAAASQFLTKRCGCGREAGVRYAVGWVQRERARQERKERVIQYQSEGAKPAERVYVWGYSGTGALGIRTYLRPEKGQVPLVRQPRPARLRFMDDNDITVYHVACGYGFTLFACKRRRRHFVMATGINTDSQLGYHEYPKNSGRVLDYIIEPVPVDLPLAGVAPTENSSKPHIQVACGRAHSVFLVQNTVFTQGNNSYGQCGRPAVEAEIFHKVSNIQKVEGLPNNIKKVVCGQDHTLFLTEDGEVYSCGLSADGQTGVGTFRAFGRPSRVEGDINGVKIIDVASKADCVLALSDQGDVFGWGNSEYQQLSMVTNDTQVSTPRHLPIHDCGRVVQVTAGGSSCTVLNDKGNVYVWGYGVLGKGPKTDMLSRPSLLPPPLFGQNELNPNIRVVSISSGMSHFAALTDSGDLFTWGKGKEGCLGLIKKTVQYFPLKVAMPAYAHTVDCGVDHTVALCRSFS